MIDETGPEQAAALWWRGGFPRSYTAPSDADSRAWRREFIRTTVEHDLPRLGITDPQALHMRPKSGDSWEGFALDPMLRIAVQDLALDALYVVYPGTRRYTLAPDVEAVPLAALLAVRGVRTASG